MRDFRKVIHAIYTATPGDQHPLKAELFNLMKNGMYMAPEQNEPLWDALSDILNRYMPRPHRKITPWQQQVIDIFRGKEGPGDEQA